METRRILPPRCILPEMNPSTETRVHDLVLIVVESPSVAAHIQSFNIPYLSVLAIRGYCWQPKWNKKTKSFSYKASPEHLDIRKELKDLSKWAVRIIIATDSDASGEFLASAIKHFLNKKTCYRAYLNDLSQNGIENLISDQNLPLANDTTEAINERKIVQDLLLKRIPDDFPVLLGFAVIGLQQIASQSDRIQFRFYKNQKYFCPNDDWALPQYPIPLNTIGFIQKCRTFSDLDFTSLQDELNRLFYEPVRVFNKNIISYPRTQESRYYLQTWRRLSQTLLNQDNNFSLIPDYLQSICPPDMAHEALHVPDLSITPELARPHLTRLHFEMYSSLYEHTIETLKMPDWSLIPENIPKKKTHPRLRLQEISKIWADSGLISVSNQGKIIDELLKEKYIFLDEDRLIINHLPF